MSAKDFATAWASLSRKVLASVLVDDGAVFPVHDIIGAHSAWVAKKERPIYEAILECLTDNTPPTVEAVTIRATGTPKGYIQSIAQLFNDEDNKHLVYNTEQLKRIGVLAEIRAFGRQLADTDTIDDITQTADKVTTELGGILAGANSRADDSKSVSDGAWELVEGGQGVIPTGLGWFDELTGGLWEGMNYWVVAPYKSGKTTVMRNCVLHAASLNNPVGAFCAEGSRELFTLDCQAMLATGILMDAGLRGSELRLDGLFIRRYYWQNGVLTNKELNALHEARDIWEGLPVHIWDSRDGIKNLATLRYMVKRGRVHHGIKSFWADYSQLFGSGTIYEKQSATSQAVQDIAATENVAFCMLAQKNEEGVKEKEDGPSANVKGGGDAAAAADFLLIPKINADANGVMDIKLKFSRHTRTAAGTHWLAPASGLIVDKWGR